MATMDFSEYSPAEREILERVREDRGEEFVENHTKVILDQARLIGDL